MKKSALLVGIAICLSAGAAQAGMVVTWPSTIAIPSNNDFKSYLNGIGLDVYASSGASIILDQAGTLTFEYLGSESGFTDTFHYGANSSTEDNNPDTALESMFSISVPAGPFSGYFTASGRGSEKFYVGDAEFGILLSRSAKSSINVNELWIALDDQIVGDDDNHDDFIIRVTFTPDKVPEPATLGLFGLGLLGMGFAGRRRRK